MATVYVRTFGFRGSLSDAEALEELRFLIDEVVPAIENGDGIRSVKLYSGAGALRSQLRLIVEMDDASGYERLLANADVREKLGRLYASWDLESSTQDFLREVTPDLVAALSGTG